MTLPLVALSLLAASAAAAAILGGRDRLAFRVSTSGTLAACAVGLAGAAEALLRGRIEDARADWPLPVGELHVGVDPLSSFFLVCLFLVAGLAALHGLGSLPSVAGRARAARAGAAFALTVAAMVGVVLARDGVLFLAAWEVMTVASYFLVAHEHDRAEVRRAGMTYLIASHLGAVFLFVLFALLARHADGFGFDAVRAAGPMAPALGGTAFALALVGFGTKAALFPLHVWAPDAYPAAPQHAAALLSGAVSKMGVYGLVRALLLLGPPEPWWGAVLVVVGAVTAIAGALNAFVQRDLKKLVAYSSVENLGIVAIGLGVGLLGKAHGAPLVAFLGFAGALLHVLNHGLMKSLLLLLAGDVADATGTRSMDRLGGLARRMPLAAALFLGGGVAISGLPPLNGFVGEWLVYAAAFRGAAGLPPGAAVLAVAAIASLALAGGFAAAAFVKAYGITFLGASRSGSGEAARDLRGPRLHAALTLAGLCLAGGLAPAAFASLPAGAAALAAGVARPDAAALGPLEAVARVTWSVLLLVGAVAALRAWLLRGREIRTAPTWGCAYEAPDPRMQYTASGFAGPALGMFEGLVARTVERVGPAGYFPSSARHVERLVDAAGDRFLVPLARRAMTALGRARVLQRGRLQLYLLYVLATLIALLAWQLLVP